MNMNLAHSADSALGDSVVFYQVKLKPACPATGATCNYNSEMPRLARLVGANNEGPDQTAPMRGCYAHLFFSHPTTSFFFLACTG